MFLSWQSKAGRSDNEICRKTPRTVGLRGTEQAGGWVEREWDCSSSVVPTSILAVTTCVKFYC